MLMECPNSEITRAFRADVEWGHPEALTSSGLRAEGYGSGDECPCERSRNRAFGTDPPANHAQGKNAARSTSSDC